MMSSNFRKILPRYCYRGDMAAKGSPARDATSADSHCAVDSTFFVDIVPSAQGSRRFVAPGFYFPLKKGVSLLVVACRVSIEETRMSCRRVQSGKPRVALLSKKMEQGRP